VGQFELKNGIEIEQPLIQRFSEDAVPAAKQPSVSGSWYESGDEPFVVMMQTADLPDGHDSSDSCVAGWGEGPGNPC
jgi:hypothetical protein